MKYTFTILEAGEREKRVLESGGDLPRHVVLKLLAYVLYRKQHPLEIERTADSLTLTLNGECFTTALVPVRTGPESRA